MARTPADIHRCDDAGCPSSSSKFKVGDIIHATMCAVGHFHLVIHTGVLERYDDHQTVADRFNLSDQALFKMIRYHKAKDVDRHPMRYLIVSIKGTARVTCIMGWEMDRYRGGIPA